MSKRHPFNPNLSLHFDRYWNGYPVQTRKGPLIVEYLQRIDETLWAANNDHHRLLIIRTDVRLPLVGEFQEKRFMRRFMSSLRSQIKADLHRKERQGMRVHRCRLRFVWAREQETSIHPHFHVGLFLNKDTYHCLGSFLAQDGNMASRITKAVASALNIPVEAARGLANFPDGGVHVLNLNAEDFYYRRALAIECLSYLAKAATKYYGNGANHFGYSQD